MALVQPLYDVYTLYHYNPSINIVTLITSSLRTLHAALTTMTKLHNKGTM